jgi:hypothetical protein
MKTLLLKFYAFFPTVEEIKNTTERQQRAS